jgi:hypothetical protein
MHNFSEDNLAPAEKDVLTLMRKGVKSFMPNVSFERKLFAKLERKFYFPQNKPWDFFVCLRQKYIEYLKYFKQRGIDFKNVLLKPAFSVLMASVLLILISGTTVYAYISPEITRQNSLYILKRTVEKIEYFLTQSIAGRIKKNLYFAERRGKELRSLFMNEKRVDQETGEEIILNLEIAYALVVEIQNKDYEQMAIADINQSFRQIKQEVEMLQKEINPGTGEKQEYQELMEEVKPFAEEQNNVLFEDNFPLDLCQDECQDEARKCQGNGYQLCGDFDQDACTEWGQVNQCGSGWSCRQGSCQKITLTCQNECVEGQRRCAQAGYQICGNYDQDQCLEWGKVSDCYAGMACTDGVCQNKAENCQSECDQAYIRRCFGNGYQICGNYDQDQCLEWGGINLCVDDHACETGVCQPQKK